MSILLDQKLSSDLWQKHWNSPSRRINSCNVLWYTHTDPTSASQDAIAIGESPRGEIPEATEESAAVDSPSGEMTVAEEIAEVPEYLPPGKKSRTESKDEDVEMDAPDQPQEEAPQDDPMNATDDAPDFGEVDFDDEQSETERGTEKKVILNNDLE